MIDQDDLEDWAFRTMQALQEVCDDAQEAAGELDGEDQAQDIRALMNEYEGIIRGKPLCQIALTEINDENGGELKT